MCTVCLPRNGVLDPQRVSVSWTPHPPAAMTVEEWSQFEAALLQIGADLGAANHAQAP